MAGGREKVIQTAERFVSRGKIQAAIKEYRKVLTANPRDANTLNRVGDLYARIERIDEAVTLFTRIAEQYSDEGFLLKAIAIYKKIIKLDPTRLPVYEKLAELYHRQGLVNEARSQYQVLADYYEKHNDAEAALTIFQRMVDLEPDNPSHRAKLADLSQRLGRVEDAIGQYKAVAEQMLSEGRLDEASKVYERALDVESEDIGFIADAVLKLKEAGRVEAAQRLLALAVARNPRAEQVARLLGQGEAAPEAEIFLDMNAAAPSPAAAAPEARPRPSMGDLDPSRQPTMELDPSQIEAAESSLEPASATPVEQAPAIDLPAVDLDFDLDDEVFTFDLEDDARPASQVVPPADLAPAGATAFLTEPELPPEADLPRPISETGEFELDLAELTSDSEDEPALAAEGAIAKAPDAQLPVAGAPASEPYAELPIEVDAEALAGVADQVAPTRELRIDELVAEAEVLAKYGLLKKTQERLEQVFQEDPRHLGGLAVLLAVHLEIGRHGAMLETANKMAQIAAQTGETYVWERTLERLERAGYVLRGDRVVPIDEAVAEEAALPPTAETAAGKAPPTVTPAVRPPTADREAKVRRPTRDLDRIVADLAASVRQGRTAPPASRPPVPAELPAEPPSVEVAGPTPASERVEVPPPEAPPAALEAEAAAVEEAPTVPEAVDATEATAAAAELDESMSWLDAAAVPEAGATAEEELFSDEQEFFDLAAELEQELSAEGGLDADNLLAQPQEQTLEEIVEGFKRGVAENLSAEDYETHFNLGIAYREMGLLDEAIGEFQLAAKGQGRLVECASMLGLCFLDKGLPELAIKWYGRGLEAPELSEDVTLGLMYDLGNAYLTFGAREAAYETFVEIYGINTGYRDVVAKLEELAP